MGLSENGHLQAGENDDQPAIFILGVPYFHTKPNMAMRCYESQPLCSQPRFGIVKRPGSVSPFIWTKSAQAFKEITGALGTLK